MAPTILEFEKPIIEIEEIIQETKGLQSTGKSNTKVLLSRMKKERRKLYYDIYRQLTPWQRTQLARHPDRPYAKDYIQYIFNEFIELHGDRQFRDDPAIIAGLAKLDNQSIIVIGQQKGRGTKENITRNFGMPHPEGFRKALRLMKLAEKFQWAIVTFIDTPGAYPGIGAEERGQAEAIASNLYAMSRLKTPIVAVVIGEGGSGGALALSVADRILILENSIYSVITPEACASIIYHDVAKAEEVAASLKLTAQELYQLKIIDEIIKEPMGGAHRNPQLAAHIIRRALRRLIKELKNMPLEELLDKRYNKFRAIGEYGIEEKK
ncbi:MAG: acetyl-CoA carboxylase carboxyltransferase subunit alpha [bacterium]